MLLLLMLLLLINETQTDEMLKKDSKKEDKITERFQKTRLNRFERHTTSGISI